MDKIVVSEASLSDSFSDSRIICRVCQRQFSRYTCPRCNTRYCALECYKRHNLRCTESFNRENVMEELHHLKSNGETKRKMLEILRRVHSEDEMNSDGEDDSMLSEETIQKFLSGHELSLDDLPPGEVKKFQRAIANGELSKLVDPWDPWWKKPSAASIALGPEGNQLIKELDEEDNDEHSFIAFDSGTSTAPAGPENPLPAIRELSRTKPSPLLSIHLIDILYSYCFSLRLYNGDRHSDPLGVAMAALNSSPVIGNDSRPETMFEALAACVEKTCSPEFKRAGGFKFALALVGDAISLLLLGSNAIICSLCDLRRIVRAGEGMLGKEKMGKGERARSGSKLRGAARKIYYIMCWVHEQADGVWSSLARIVEVERDALFEMGDDDRRKFEMGGRIDAFNSKLLIEEI